MDPKKRWRCPGCGGIVDDEQRLITGCPRCLQLEFERRMQQKYYDNVATSSEPSNASEQPAD